MIFHADPSPLFGFFLAGLAAGVLELGRLIRHRGLPFRWPVVMAAVLAIGALAGFGPGLPAAWGATQPGVFWTVLIAAMLALGLWEMLAAKAEASFPGLAAQCFAILMLGGVGSYIFRLRLLPQGVWWITILFGFNWLYDAGAYFGGRWFGRRPLAPAISPAKTVEGLLGGLLANGAVSLIVYFTLLPRELGFSAAGFAALAVVQGLLAQAGDLTESLIKRWSGMKDSAGLIPGHGGVLDKFDSAFYTAPILYWFASFFMQ